MSDVWYFACRNCYILWFARERDARPLTYVSCLCQNCVLCRTHVFFSQNEAQVLCVISRFDLVVRTSARVLFVSERAVCCALFAILFVTVRTRRTYSDAHVLFVSERAVWLSEWDASATVKTLHVTHLSDWRFARVRRTARDALVLLFNLLNPPVTHSSDFLSN